MRFRALVIAVFCVPLFASVGACSGDDAGSNPPVADAKSAPEAIVGASDETRAALGVSEWHVMPGDAERSIRIAGLDAQGTIRAELGITVESRGEGAGILTYDVRAPQAFKLTYEWDASGPKTNVADIANLADARAVIERSAADLSQVDVKSGQSLTQSVHPLSTGGATVSNGQQLVKPGQCLRDSSGNGCVGQLVQVGAGLVLTGACLVGAGFTFGAIMVGCLAGAVQTAGAAYSMYESGCKPRPCQ